MCKFEIKKRTFPRGNPGFLGEFFPEKSGKIRKNLENSGFSEKIRENPGNSGMSQTQNFMNFKKFNLNLNFSRKCREDTFLIFDKFSGFLWSVNIELSFCKFTRFYSDF